MGASPWAVFESGAVLLYLAEKSGNLMAADWRRFQAAQQWLVWQVAGLGPMLGQANHFCRYAPEGQDYAVQRYLREARRPDRAGAAVARQGIHRRRVQRPTSPASPGLRARARTA